MAALRSDHGDVSNADEQIMDLVEQITDRLHRGEEVDLRWYLDKYPQYAAQIERLVPAVRAVEDLAQAPSKVSTGSAAKDVITRELGDFRIVREVGRGGMGVVYEAEQISLRRQVALKVLPFAAILDQRQLNRFKNEAHAAAMLHHTNIVPVYGVGCERGVHYYAMQYIDGYSLAEVIRDLRQLDAERNHPNERSEPASTLTSWQRAGDRPTSTPANGHLAGHDMSLADTQRTPAASLSTERSPISRDYFRNLAQLGMQVAEALDHAHSQGVIHRDIKPANLLLDAAGRIWITDFGLARATGDPGVTMTGDLVGTVRYMSPEQVLAKRVVVDHRTDIYSLGATLYELAVLQPPFQGEDRQELLRQIAFEEPTPPRRINRAVPTDLATIILKCMAKNPAERYSSASEVVDDLQLFLDDCPIRAKRPTIAVRVAKWCRRRRGVVAGFIGVATVLLISAVVVGIFIVRQASVLAMQRVEIVRKIAHLQVEAQNRLHESTLASHSGEMVLLEAQRYADQAIGLCANPLTPPEIVQECEEIAVRVGETLNHLRQRIRTARERTIPEIRDLLARERGVSAMTRLRDVEEVIPQDPEVLELARKNFTNLSILVQPEGSTVEVRDWNDGTGSWVGLGLAPLQSVRLPLGALHIRLSKEGFQPMEGLCLPRDNAQESFTMVPSSYVPAGMILIPSGFVQVRTTGHSLAAFMIDCCEVTNAQYQVFVNAGGYRKREYWKHPFERDGRTLSFDEAMELLVDKSGIKGPAGWQDGRCPEGEMEYPVSGVSWYEAAAYACFAGKRLPSVYQWRRAGAGQPRYLTEHANIGAQKQGPEPAGSSSAISQFGLRDIAGNVAEWCWNEAADGKRHTQGGCWSDPPYMLHLDAARSPWTRTPEIGFRCAICSGPDEERIYGPLKRDFFNYRDAKPMPDDRFETMMDVLYRPTTSSANPVAQLESRNPENGRMIERWLIEPQRGEEELPVTVCTTTGRPKASLVYFPGANCLTDNVRSFSNQSLVMTLANAGYELLWPTYLGTYERRGDGYPWDIVETKLRVVWCQEVGTTLKFARQRNPQEAVVFVGFSMGGTFGPQAIVTNVGFDAAVLLAAGYHAHASARPETLETTFLPRVNVPTLMVTGKFDDIFPIRESQDPFFELLGSKSHLANKQRHIFDSGHSVPVAETVRLVDQWLVGVLAERDALRSQQVLKH